MEFVKNTGIFYASILMRLSKFERYQQVGFIEKCGDSKRYPLFKSGTNYYLRLVTVLKYLTLDKMERIRIFDNKTEIEDEKYNIYLFVKSTSFINQRTSLEEISDKKKAGIVLSEDNREFEVYHFGKGKEYYVLSDNIYYPLFTVRFPPEHNDKIKIDGIDGCFTFLSEGMRIDPKNFPNLVFKLF